MEPEDFAARLRSARMAAGMSPEEMGAVIGVKAHGYRALERGEGVKQYLQLANIASSLITSPNKLLGFDDPPKLADLYAASKPFLEYLGLTADQCAAVTQAILTAIEQPPIAPGRLDPSEDLGVRAAMLVRLLSAEGKIPPPSNSGR